MLATLKVILTYGLHSSLQTSFLQDLAENIMSFHLNPGPQDHNQSETSFQLPRTSWPSSLSKIFMDWLRFLKFLVEGASIKEP